ncbi:MAG: 4-vinyl reductase [Desulfovibrio sp.]|jgi:predicted hydrocarbon binding protein|nr:4-vinyl reductase [Desulfovibrio sp.]
MTERLYKFSWDFIGDVEEGRPNLGNTTRIEVYRLFQYTMRDVLEERFGTEAADRILYDAGHKAGLNFCRRFADGESDLNAYLEKVKESLMDLKIGILRVESADTAKSNYVLTIAEDLDCSGLPDMGHTVCNYDEGFISGIFYAFGGQKLNVKESDCWCTSDRTCRFQVTPPSPT